MLLWYNITPLGFGLQGGLLRGQGQLQLAPRVNESKVLERVWFKLNQVAHLDI
jgi:hypothetical protein